METAPPSPEPCRFASDGVSLAGRLFRPAGEPRGALVVCHGAGSRKENHELMGEQAAAADLAALTFDFRGHGQSGGVLDSGAAHDPSAAARFLLATTGAPWVAARGASMGGTMLLLAAHDDPGLFGALVLLCPADGASLLVGLDALERGAPPEAGYTGRFDAPSLRPFLEALDLVAVAGGMPRVLLAHARDDDAVPFAHSERLALALAEPTRFVVLPHGGHHGPGRSPELAKATLEWVVEHGAGGARGQRRGAGAAPA